MHYIHTSYNNLKINRILVIRDLICSGQKSVENIANEITELMCQDWYYFCTFRNLFRFLTMLANGL
jgi:hypothetical protein